MEVGAPRGEEALGPYAVGALWLGPGQHCTVQGEVRDRGAGARRYLCSRRRPGLAPGRPGCSRTGRRRTRRPCPARCGRAPGRLARPWRWRVRPCGAPFPSRLVRWPAGRERPRQPATAGTWRRRCEPAAAGNVAHSGQRRRPQPKTLRAA